MEKGLLRGFLVSGVHTVILNLHTSCEKTTTFTSK